MAVQGAMNLKDIKKKAEQSSTFNGESPFLSIKDGEKVKIRYLQEMDDESPTYDERHGKVTVVMEHVSPKDFKLRAVCTAESEDRCWACEQINTSGELGKKWKPKMRYYSNVLVRNPDDEDKVKILAQGFGDKATGGKLLNIAEEFGAITDKDCSFSRKGKGVNDTSYDLLPLAPKPLTKEELELELIDLSKFIKYYSYDQQAEFYSGQAVEESGSAEEWTS